MDRFYFIYSRLFVLALLAASPVSAAEILVTPNGSAWDLTLEPPSTTFHTTEADVTNERVIPVPNTTVLLLLWDEQLAGGRVVPYYALSFDGVAVSRIHRTSYVLMLTAGHFDPLQGVPAVHPSLQADAGNELYIVQFLTQPLREFSDAIEGLGGTIRGYLPDNGRIIQMDDPTKTAVESLSYVRWVGPYHPAYRLEGYLRDNIDQAEELFPLQPYNILVFERGLGQKTVVADHIETSGGTVDEPTPGGFGLRATLTPTQLLSVVHRNDLAFLSRWFPPQEFMNIARRVGYAEFVENVGGFTGQGVIGEVMDDYLGTDPFHQALGIPIFHGFPTVVEGHGTKVYGTIFGDGTGANNPAKKGIIPDAQGVFADFCKLTDRGCCTEIAPEERSDRYCHTCELVNPISICDFTGEKICPQGYGAREYNAVFQSNSWGGADALAFYYGGALEIDDVLFTYEITLCQAQGNAGRPDLSSYGAPEAVAKNAVSVGGVWHFDSSDLSDHQWESPFPRTPEDPDGDETASTGPAWDGRIKPDFTHFFDKVYTTQQGGGYDIDFGGTSAATPITCGHFGLFFQMWHEGVFSGFGGGASVFDSRPHMSTAKAMMINTARQYSFVQAPPPADLHDHARTRQGWGLPDVGKLYLLRDQFLHIDDEGTVLQLDGSQFYLVNVEPNTYALKVTMVYTDPAGAPSVDRHAINDVNLKVSSPSYLVYWGNCGLREGNWSDATCTGPNPLDPRHPVDAQLPVRDTVENVFIQYPEAGYWIIKVLADEICEDGHTETPEDDVDFALVVSVDMDCNQNQKSDADDILKGLAQDTNNNAIPDSCEISTALAAPYPHDRRKNRYISFDPNKADNDGTNVAFKVQLTDLVLGSCSGNGGFCRQKCSVTTSQPCTSDVDCPAGESCTSSDCKACSVVGNACINEPIDCAPSPAQTCDPTGETCVNDAPDAGGTNVGRIWWVGPEHPSGNGVHLLVSEPFKKVSTAWPNPTHVGDCEVVPQGTYAVTAVNVDTGMESAALDIETTRFASINSAWWGDAVGPLKKFCGGDIRTPECVDDNDCTPPETCDFAWTLPEGSTNFDDVNAALAAFSPGPTSTAPHITWVDLHGNESGRDGSHEFDPPNYVANFADIDQFIFAFQGRPYTFHDPADCPDDADWPVYGGSSPPGGSPVFTLVPSDDLLDPGQDVQIEVFVSEATNVFGHEVALEATGGTSGTLTVIDITVDQSRSDYLFSEVSSPLEAKDLPGMRVGSSLNATGAGVTKTGQVYLATFTLQPSGGASGVFTINVVGETKSFLLNPDGSPQVTDTSGTALVAYGVDCLDVEDCHDNNECTTDTCTASNACQYTNVASGTACDDGLWCTRGGSTCDGNGLCTGGAPRCQSGELCIESTQTCAPELPPLP